MFITLTLLQVTVFNHICLFNLAVPFVFIYFIVRLPITMSINWILTLAFILGLIVDIFSDTHGMHALACTITAMSRRRILQLYFPREDDLTDPQPSIKTLGFGIYVKYLFTLVLFYCFLICRKNSPIAAAKTAAAYPRTHQRWGRICSKFPLSAARSISTAWTKGRA